ncbi:hypothetical protein LPJ81_003109, partial [Coemansia sp. IMI 209127]
LTIPPNAGLEKYAIAACIDGDDNDDDDGGELPEAVVPTSGFRASMVSFQSNMAVNFNAEPTGRVSFSNSNPRSASIFDSHYRTTPVQRSPTVLDTMAHHMSTNSGSAHHSSFPSAKIYNRPSLDAITPTSPDKRHSSDDSAVEASPLDTAGATIRHQKQRQYQRQSVAVANHAGSDGDEDNQPPTRQRPMSSSAAFNAGNNIALQLKHAFSVDHQDNDDDGTSRQLPNDPTQTNDHGLQHERRDPNGLGTLDSVERGSDSDSSVALRVVNQSSARGSDDFLDKKGIDDDQLVPAAASGVRADNNNYDEDEDDDRPLMSLPRPQRDDQQRPSLYISTNPKQLQQQHSDQPANSNGVVCDSVESDDDQPLSSLLIQPNAASDEDLGGLPLPMPRHVIDPDAVANINDMVNETVVPLRTSIGERPVSPRGTRGSAVRKESSLSRSFRMADHKDDPADDTADYIRSPMPAKRRSNLSTCIDLGDDGRLSQPKGHVMNGVPIIEGDSESEDNNNNDRSNAPSPQQPDFVEEMGRPWARNSEYNPSTTSLGSHRKTQRGSTLGQQLTEEMHNLRMGLARAQRDNSDRTPRQSWQGGNAPPIQQPWLRKESALSDTALPHKLETLQRLTAGADANGGSRGVGDPSNGNQGFLDALAAAGRGDVAPKMVSSWSFTDNQRPLSIQPQRRSRWFGKGNGVTVNHSSNPSLQQPNVDIQANNASASFSSRFKARVKNYF